jgi:omega-6 fatty acid desaturase (delta-12 desaturase)
MADLTTTINRMERKTTPIDHSFWNAVIPKYQTPRVRSSIWQICDSFLPFFALWYLMALSIDVSYLLTIGLSFIAAGFMARIFIIQHDCGHGSFFRSQKANDAVGMIASVLTLTPYHYWRKSHAIHHAGAGKLDKRGIGDIYTMTVDEFLALSRWGKLKYRVYRNPVVLFVLAPTFLFAVIYRFPISRMNALRKVEASVWLTDLAIAAVSAGMILLVGWKTFLAIQIPITVATSGIGMWLFYVQHQFEDTYWSKSNEWDFAAAALHGSSFYRLPKVLQWFTGNIGFHHVHHLSPKIPNYLLEKVHTEVPAVQGASVLTLKTSLRSMPLTLWDERRKKLISFSQLKKLSAGPAVTA